jgi:ferrochelatase
MTRGVLLVNLGSPESTDPADVREYLREFLSDDRVLDSPKLVQQTVLNLFILPFRPKRSAEAYQKIWTDEGSPLIISTESQRDLLRDRLDMPVEMGMRYGSPTTADGIRRLVSQGVDEIFLVPLYPHYAMSSYETAVAKAREELAKISPTTRMTVQPPFYEAPDYIDALYEVARPHLEQNEWDALLFSYHGIPERHLRKGDPSGCYCLQTADCCDVQNPVHSMCYRAQCFATTRAFARRAGLSSEQWRLSFQSRLGREPWLTPYTDVELERFPSQGIKRLLVMCPAFVSDCLETLEEINMEGRHTFIEAGGHEFTYIPCLNDHSAWIDVLERMVGDWEAGELAA